ncbi:MAG: hypothetical protein AB1898_18820 [Acidobacteriota bacterium]
MESALKRARGLAQLKREAETIQWYKTALGYRDDAQPRKELTELALRQPVNGTLHS